MGLAGLGARRKESDTMAISTRRTVRTFAGLAAASSLAIALAVPAFASHVTPTPISDTKNPTCSDYGAWLELKVDPPGNGIFTDGTLAVTISNYVQSTSDTPGSFDWVSNIGVDAVLVKAGDDKHNLYVYSPEATSDEDLSPQSGDGNGISHISFCYDEDDPDESIPDESIPEESIPEESIPEESIPEESIPEESLPDESQPEGTPAGEQPTPAESEREGTLGSTPRPGGTVPNTAAQPWTGVPASVLGLVLLASLGALVYVRLAQEPTER
jgi:hypothetical protein